jgi:hypothetical protein
MQGKPYEVGQAGFVKLDKKFEGLITKVKDKPEGGQIMGSIVPNDQWVVFLAKDNAFAGPDGAIYAYLDRCVALGADPEQVRAVETLIARIEQWREVHPDLL